MLEREGEFTLLRGISKAEIRPSPGISEILYELAKHALIDKQTFLDYVNEPEEPFYDDERCTEKYFQHQLRGRLERQLRGKGMEALSFVGDPDQGGVCGLQEKFQKGRAYPNRIVSEQLNSNQPLSYFYDYTRLTEPSNNMRFIHSAEGEELFDGLGPEEFEVRYGLPIRLAFKPRNQLNLKSLQKIDWWEGVYR